MNSGVMNANRIRCPLSKFPRPRTTVGHATKLATFATDGSAYCGENKKPQNQKVSASGAQQTQTLYDSDAISSIDAKRSLSSLTNSSWSKQWHNERQSLSFILHFRGISFSSRRDGKLIWSRKRPPWKMVNHNKQPLPGGQGWLSVRKTVNRRKLVTARSLPASDTINENGSRHPIPSDASPKRQTSRCLA